MSSPESSVSAVKTGTVRVKHCNDEPVLHTSCPLTDSEADELYVDVATQLDLELIPDYEMIGTVEVGGTVSFTPYTPVAGVYGWREPDTE